MKKNRKVNLIVLADWSFLETDKYQPLDKIFNSLQSDKEINGMLINGDIGYDLWTNNCQNYEKFIVMLVNMLKLFLLYLLLAIISMLLIKISNSIRRVSKCIR